MGGEVMSQCNEMSAGDLSQQIYPRLVKDFARCKIIQPRKKYAKAASKVESQGCADDSTESKLKFNSANGPGSDSAKCQCLTRRVGSV